MLSSVLTCRVVAKWRRLPVIVAGWLALEREKRMQVTNSSDPLQVCLCCKFTPFFLKVCGTSSRETHGFRESLSLCTANYQKCIQVQLLCHSFWNCCNSIACPALPLPSVYQAGFLGNNQCLESTWTIFIENIWSNITHYQVLCTRPKHTPRFYWLLPASWIWQLTVNAQRIPYGLCSHPPPRLQSKTRLRITSTGFRPILHPSSLQRSCTDASAQVWSYPSKVGMRRAGGGARGGGNNPRQRSINHHKDLTACHEATRLHCCLQLKAVKASFYSKQGPVWNGIIFLQGCISYHN